MPAPTAPLPKPKTRRPRRRVRGRPAAPAIGEDQVQRSVIQFLEVLGWYVCHIPTGGRDGRHRGRMRRQSYKAGFPDLYCDPPDPSLPPILIECKRPGASPSLDQCVTHVELRARGREVWVVDDPAQLWEEHGVRPTPEAAAVLREQLGWRLPPALFGHTGNEEMPS